MKKKEKIYAVNNQEDEDGYTLFHANAIPEEDLKSEQKMAPPDRSKNSGRGTRNQEPRIFVLSKIERAGN